MEVLFDFYDFNHFQGLLAHRLFTCMRENLEGNYEWPWPSGLRRLATMTEVPGSNPGLVGFRDTFLCPPLTRLWEGTGKKWTQTTVRRKSTVQS